MAISFLPRFNPRKRHHDSASAPHGGKPGRTPTRPVFENLEDRRLLSAVTGLILVNADTGKDIAPLTNGETINLAKLPTRHLNVRAQVTSDTRSVKFAYDTAPIHVENWAPYDLAGDSGWGHYSRWTPKVGSHTLVATPYTRYGLHGQAGTSDKVTFKVIDNAGTPTP
ncbi:MAG: Ig family protein, partial [Phycisphaerales bacterium]|nr:Ig family protein [Phycisphaerales bacterium]